MCHDAVVASKGTSIASRPGERQPTNGAATIDENGCELAFLAKKRARYAVSKAEGQETKQTVDG